MCKNFIADDEYAIETTHNMNPAGPEPAMRAGLMKAHISVWEPGEYAHPTLPNLREFLAKNTDPKTRLLSYTVIGSNTLTIDPTPLRELPAEYLEYRVSPGCSFVTHEAHRRMQARKGPGT